MIIFLYGEDAFRAGLKVKEIKNKFLDTDKSASGLSVFDYADKERRGTPLDVFGTGNLLASKRLLIVKNLLSAGTESDQKEILEYLEKNKSPEKDNDLVAIFFEEGKPKKTGGLFKYLEKSAKSQNFEKLSGAKLEQWILKRIKTADQDASIARPALARLIAYAGNDTFLLDKEIEKLVNFSDGNLIIEADVEKLVKANVDSNIFATIDALAARNKAQALKFLHNHLQRGDDPFYMFSMFVYQFRNILEITDLKENHGMHEYAIAKETKLHPFVVKKGLMQGRNFSLAGLKKIYQKLADLDLQVKTGQMEIILALDKFIVEL